MNKIYRSEKDGSWYVYNKFNGYKAKLYPFAFEKHEHKIMHKLCTLMNAQEEAFKTGSTENLDKLESQIDKVESLIAHIEQNRINYYITLLTGKDWALANEIILEADTRADEKRALVH